MSLEKDIEGILANHRDAKRDALIPIMQEIQESRGYLSREAVSSLASAMDLPASKIYGVATFYNQFRFHPLGRYHIQVCRGTACHVKGSAVVLDELKRELKISPQQTTRDGLFSLEVVACVGACGLAPVISINGEIYSGVKSEDVKGILDTYRGEAIENESAD